MLGWKRKSDGFIWREHVRTTILIRRDQRRQRIEDIKVAAVEGVKDVGRKGAALGMAGAQVGAAGASAGAKLGAAGAKIGAAGAKRAAASIVRGTYLGAMAVADVGVAVIIATWLWLVDTAGPTVAAATRILSGGLTRLLAPCVDGLHHPLATPVLVLTAMAAFVSASARVSTTGFDTDARVAAAVAIFCLVLLAVAQWPAMKAGARATARATGLDRLTLPAGLLRHGPALGLVAMLVTLVVLGSISGFWSGGVRGFADSAVAVVQSGTRVIASGNSVEGRAAAVSGIRLKVAGNDLRLDGVEAPEPSQMCGQRTCAALAKAALQKLVQGKRATCAISGTTSNGRDGHVPGATCTVDGADVAAQLVRGGSVFSMTGLFASYSSQEREARNGNLGVWRAGIDRPADHRSKVWEEAKKAAPDGCPIKGVVNSNMKTYVAPWSANYDKAKVKASRGDRWFCTEDEARAAGWKSAEG